MALVFTLSQCRLTGQRQISPVEACLSSNQQQVSRLMDPYQREKYILRQDAN